MQCNSYFTGGVCLCLHLVTMDHSCCTLSDPLLAFASVNLQEKIPLHLSSDRCHMIRAIAFNLIKQLPHHQKVTFHVITSMFGMLTFQKIIRF